MRGSFRNLSTTLVNSGYNLVKHGESKISLSNNLDVKMLGWEEGLFCFYRFNLKRLGKKFGQQRIMFRNII